MNITELKSIQEEADILAYELSFFPKMNKKQDEKYLMQTINLLQRLAKQFQEATEDQP